MMFCAADPVRNLAGFHLPGSRAGSMRGTLLTIKGKSMKQFTIKLNDIKDVKNFVTAVNAYTFDVDLVTGRYITDAKSIMGAQDLEPFIVTE